MNFFESLFVVESKHTPSVVYQSEAEAVFAILFACIHSDEVVCNEENERFMQIIMADAGISALGLTSTMGRMLQLRERYTLAAMVQAAVKNILPENRNAVFAKAVDLMIVDGSLPQQEKDMLQLLQQGLDISDADAMQIAATVMLEGNR